ncbi:hypothetical protein A0H81_13140 [Grifola frondosa]|uniref:Uncharacterized protein n=1 Tax=Grifola frondosa TaxID=5627 RepID=A0A1C7LQ31_GRIFR|nr:hypothetical protein A0H81_13140 [Grifola frondosa]
MLNFCAISRSQAIRNLELWARQAAHSGEGADHRPLRPKLIRSQETVSNQTCTSLGHRDNAMIVLPLWASSWFIFSKNWIYLGLLICLVTVTEEVIG